MKRLFIAVLIASTSLLAFGDAASQSNAALLAQLNAHSKTIQSLQGHFVQQKNIAVLPVPLNSTGQFQFEQGKEVIWEVLTPVHNTLHLTPKGISFESEQGKAQNSAIQQQAGVEVVAKIFMGVIAGELDSLNAYFAVQASGDIKHWKLLLTPRSPNLAAYLQNIELQGSEFTEQLTIAETNGDKTNIRFTTDKVIRKAE